MKKALLAVCLAAALVTTGVAQTANIVDTAVAAHFNTLAAALKAADLVDTLKGPDPYTVFAPTDEAFAKLAPGILDDLVKPENKAKPQRILKYHVVTGRVMAADVVKLRTAKTVEGQAVAVRTEKGKVMINGAVVTKADIAASNGVIHVIDTVLMPPKTSTRSSR